MVKATCALVLAVGFAGAFAVRDAAGAADVRWADSQPWVPAQKPQSPPAPRDVTLCQLVANRKAYDRTRIRITALVEYEFEHFMLSDPSCDKDTRFGFWVAFGGDVPSGAIYCCPGEGMPGATKPSRAAEFPLVADRTYRRFRSLLESEGDTTVRFTAVGTVLAKPETGPGEINGYGHFGCCSLFLVERIEGFEDHNWKDVSYKSSGALYEGRGCLGTSTRDPGDWPELGAVAEQRDADAGSRSWAFDDPRRVALEGLRRDYGQHIDDIELVRTDSGLRIFEWRHDREWLTAVVLRPYWLSAVAKTKRIVWTVAKTERASCDVNISADSDVGREVPRVLAGRLNQVTDPRLPANTLRGREGERSGRSAIGDVLSTL